jgi:hypothetical protein
MPDCSGEEKSVLVGTFGITIIAVLLFAYVMAIRPWHLQWGATHLDRVAVLPGDELSPRAPSQITRAIAVAAPPERVWPFVEKIAKERAAERRMVVAIERPPQALFFVGAADLERTQAGDEALDETWTFFLKPLPGATTRVIARLRAASFPGLGTRLKNFFFWEPAHFLMERKMLLSIKESAENKS